MQAKRGNSDLQCLQSCVSMVSEMEAVYLEDIAAMRPHFKAIHSLCKSVYHVSHSELGLIHSSTAEEVSQLCNDILHKERECLVRHWSCDSHVTF